jgi:hypothetical protein
MTSGGRAVPVREDNGAAVFSAAAGATYDVTFVAR